MEKQSFDNRIEGGFTLVEIMIALFILTVGIMGVTGMFISTIKANQLARNNTAANRLVQNLMEQVKTAPFSTIVLGMCTDTGITNCVTDPTPPANTTIRTGTFKQGSDLNAITYNVELRQVEDAKMDNLNTVSVTVTWSDSYGNHTAKAITYMEQ